MEPANKKYKIIVGPQGLWALNVCVACTKPLDSTSKILKCLHGMCNRCFKSNSKVSGHFVCNCGKETGLSTGLINYSFACEQLNKSILRNNYMAQEYQEKVYGTYIMKAPCPNCVGKCIEVYCTTCTQFHCGLCQLSNHRSHNYKNIEIVMEEIRSNVFKNKTDLCEKSIFAVEAKLYLEKDINKLNTKKDGIIKKIHKHFDEIRAELSRSEDKMTNYVEMYYKIKLEKTSETILAIDGSKEKYDFYINFSESVLKPRNKADLFITNLVDKQLQNVRENFTNDFRKFETTNPNIDLKVKFNDTMHQLIKSIKKITIHNPHKYEEEINDINKTADIKSCPGYLNVTAKVEAMPPTIVDDNQIKKIIEFNCARQERKRLNSQADKKSNKIFEYKDARQERKIFNSAEKESSYSVTNPSNEIQAIQRLHNQNLLYQPGDNVSNNRHNRIYLPRRKAAYKK